MYILLPAYASLDVLYSPLNTNHFLYGQREILQFLLSYMTFVVQLDYIILHKSNRKNAHGKILTEKSQT